MQVLYLVPSIPLLDGNKNQAFAQVNTVESPSVLSSGNFVCLFAFSCIFFCGTVFLHVIQIS